MEQRPERRQYSAEYKVEALRLLEQGNKSVTELARELGIHPSQLWQWRRKERRSQGSRPEDVFPGNGKGTSAEEEVQRLKRELEQVRLELDFLKKAAAYFANESK